MNDNIITLNLIETWPKELITLLGMNNDLIINYIRREDEINKLSREDVFLRTNRPGNAWKISFEKFKNTLTLNLQQRQFRSFHCTRITKFEINDILQNGLKPLYVDFQYKRIQRIINDGLLDKRIGEIIFDKGQIDIENRENLTFFFHSTETLKDEDCLHRLFRSWGGEAFYHLVEDIPEVFCKINQIGIPCIVEFTVDYEICNFWDLELRIINYWLNPNGYDIDFDNWVSNKVLPTLRIIQFNDDEFEKLTEFRSWKNKIN